MEKKLLTLVRSENLDSSLLVCLQCICNSRILSVFEPSKKNDNCLVSFWPLKDELYAATEGHVTYRVDPETLESMDRVRIHFYFAHYWF